MNISELESYIFRQRNELFLLLDQQEAVNKAVIDLENGIADLELLLFELKGYSDE